MIELLVVISIIALLVGILLPALAAARAAGNNVKCMSNLRQLGVGIQMYGADNKNFAVPQGYRSTTTRPAYYSAGVSPTFYDAILLGQYTGRKGTVSTPAGATAPGGGIWRCPQDQLTDMKKVSYGMLYRNYGNGSGQFFAHIKDDLSWNRLKRLDDATNSSKLLTFIDSSGGSFSIGSSFTASPLYGNASNTPNSSSFNRDEVESRYNHRMWHAPGSNGSNRGSNIGFVDGHVKTIAAVASDVAGYFWLKPSIGVDFDLTQ